MTITADDIENMLAMADAGKLRPVRFHDNRNDEEGIAFLPRNLAGAIVSGTIAIADGKFDDASKSWTVNTSMARDIALGLRQGGSLMLLDAETRSTVLAALLFWIENYDDVETEAILKAATGNGRHERLPIEAVEEVCDTLMTGD